MSAVARQTEPQAEEPKSLTILEHLQELRQRLMICAGALVLGMVVSFYPITTWVLEWLKKPAESRVENFDLVFTQPLEFWTTFFRVSLLVGLTLAMPVFVYQVLAFIGPGLTKNEKRWAYPIVLGASGMFVAGCAFAYYVEMPPALKFLLDPPGDLARPLISVKYYVDFATRLMLVTGLVFETPLLVMGLGEARRRAVAPALALVALRPRRRLHPLRRRHALDRPDNPDAGGAADDRAVLRRHRPGAPGGELADHPASVAGWREPLAMWDRVDRNTIVLAVLGGVAAIAVLIVLVVTFAGPAGVPFGATPMPEAVATLAPTPTAAYQGYEPPPGTFFGDFNGFTFFNPVLESIGAAPACNGTPTTGVSDAGGGNATPEDIASSRLNISPVKLPAVSLPSHRRNANSLSTLFRIARIYD